MTCNSPSKLLDCGACFYFIEILLYSSLNSLQSYPRSYHEHLSRFSPKCCYCMLSRAFLHFFHNNQEKIRRVIGGHSTFPCRAWAQDLSCIVKGEKVESTSALTPCTSLLTIPWIYFGSASTPGLIITVFKSEVWSVKESSKRPCTAWLSVFHTCHTVSLTTTRLDASFGGEMSAGGYCMS